jgi:xanthine dehydrogenase accessory factor
VEGDIWFAASELLRDGGGAELKDYTLTEDLAARDGLVCGGTMYFLLDPIRAPAALAPHAREVVEAYEGGKPVAMATLTKSPPRSGLAVGARLLVREDGTTDGSLGDAGLDHQAARTAQDLTAHGKNTYLTTREGAQIYVEAYTTPPTMVLLGGGHISKALSGLATTFGFRLYVVDDRPEFANPDRFPMAEDTVVAPYDQGLDMVPVNANTFIVIATRGHKYDDLATEAAARSAASYIGLIGSKRKSLLIFEELFRKGITEERIRGIRAPVGLDIGGRTPEEIALSIMAEIQMYRLGGAGKPMRMDDRLFKKAMEKGLKAQERGLAVAVPL